MLAFSPHKPAKHNATSAAGRKDFQVHDYSNDTRGADAATIAADAPPAASAPAARAEAPASDTSQRRRHQRHQRPPSARR